MLRKYLNYQESHRIVHLLFVCLQVILPTTFWTTAFVGQAAASSESVPTITSDKGVIYGTVDSPYMKLKILALPEGSDEITASAEVGLDGKYVLANLPPGVYALQIWGYHSGRGYSGRKSSGPYEMPEDGQEYIHFEGNPPVIQEEDIPTVTKEAIEKICQELARLQPSPKVVYEKYLSKDYLALSYKDYHTPGRAKGATYHDMVEKVSQDKSLFTSPYEWTSLQMQATAKQVAVFGMGTMVGWKDYQHTWMTRYFRKEGNQWKVWRDVIHAVGRPWRIFDARLSQVEVKAGMKTLLDYTTPPVPLEINTLGPLLERKRFVLRKLLPGKSAYQLALWKKILTEENLLVWQKARIAKWKTAFAKKPEDPDYLLLLAYLYDVADQMKLSYTIYTAGAPPGSYAHWATTYYQRFLQLAGTDDPMRSFVRHRLEVLKPQLAGEPELPEPEYRRARDKIADKLAAEKDPMHAIRRRETYFRSAAVHAIDQGDAAPADLRQIGQIYQLKRQGKHQEVQKAAEAFLAEFPKHQLAISVMFVLGHTYVELKKLPEALRLYETLAENYPDDLGVQFQAKQAMAFIKQKQGKGEEELVLRKELARLYPQQITLQLEVAYNHLRLRHFTKAESLYKELLPKAGKQAAHIHMRLGEIYFRQGKYKQAAAKFDTAVKLAPKNYSYQRIRDEYQKRIREAKQKQTKSQKKPSPSRQKQ